MARVKIPEKAKLALLGLAVGDAFGAPFEGHQEAPRLSELSLEKGRYLDSWDDVELRVIPRCRMPGLYTDDTQQALALLTTWSHKRDSSEADRLFLNICSGMSTTEVKGATFGVHRGTGRNFRRAIRTGCPVDTAGLGASMRVGPVAVCFSDPQRMVEWVLRVSKVTTTNPIALASAAKFATVAWMLAYPEKKKEVRRIKWPTKDVPQDMWDATSKALHIMRTKGEEALLEFSGEMGWPITCAANGFALTGVPWAVYHALTAPSFSEAIKATCSRGGDTDTVAAMTGCLAALRFGKDAILSWMVDGLVGKDHILHPVRWDPLRDEATLTKLDVAYRGKLAKRELETDIFDFLVGEEEKEPKPILFYGAKGDLGWLSNFYLARFTLDGESWPSVEHYYMAQKNLEDAEYQKAIREVAWPSRAKKLGRQVELRDGWDDMKYDIMFRAVRAKFEQNPDLKAKLLATGDAPIHENCRDPWWGGGPNFKGGRDWLGQILMKVRDLLSK